MVSSLCVSYCMGDTTWFENIQHTSVESIFQWYEINYKGFATKHSSLAKMICN